VLCLVLSANNLERPLGDFILSRNIKALGDVLLWLPLNRDALLHVLGLLLSILYLLEVLQRVQRVLELSLGLGVG